MIEVIKNHINFCRIIFGIGSNIGDKEVNIFSAISKLQKYLELQNIKSSAIFKNPAMLPPEAPDSWNQEFYNIAMSADINIKQFAPLKILEIIKNIEKEIGRKDSPRWAPREIDIDILIIENKLIEIKNILTIPHRGLFERDFFYKTTQEIESNLLNKFRVK